MNTLMMFLSLLQWSALEPKQTVVLNETIKLESKSITAAPILLKGLKLRVTDVLPLDEIRVYNIKLSPVENCSASMKKQESKMTIIHNLYGAQLEKDCKISLFVELKDLNQPSPLQLYKTLHLK